MKKVFVTGSGIISALGRGVEENRQKLRNSITGIGKARLFKSKHTENRLFGEVPFSDQHLRELAGLTGDSGLSRTDLLAILAFEDSVKQAQLTTDELQSQRTALITAGTVGGMCHTDALFSDATSVDHPPSPYIETYAAGAHMLELVKRSGIKGYTATINTACSSSANAIMLGARLIKAGKADRVVAGGVDSLGKFTVNGFNSLGILSAGQCRPFDEARDGLNLGEGAAYLVLESEEAAAGKDVFAEIKGFGNSNDAFHPSAISEDAVGPVLAMQKALKSAALDPSAIDFINAHGTGTENNDQTELKAFTTVFDKVPPFVSTKCYTGHTLGAAGAVEAVFSILALRYGEHYAALGVRTPVSPFGLFPVREYACPGRVNNVMSNSFGFAGNCTSLIFGKP